MNKHFFTENRQRLRELLPEGAVVAVSAHTLMQRSGDTNFPFRQDSNFYYLTGVSEPDCLLVMSGGRDILIIPDPEYEHELWLGDQLTPEKAKKTSGVGEVVLASQAAKLLPALVNGRQVYMPVQGKSREKSTRNQSSAIWKQRLRRHGAKGFKTLNPALAELRVIKQEPEIKLIEQLVSKTLTAIEELKITPGQYEYEVEAYFDYEFRRQGAVHGYAPIIASGANACVLHYQQNSQRLVNNSLLLVDVGAECHNYSADISRTLVVGQPAQRQLDVLNAVKSIQEQAFGYLKPGVTFSEFSKATRELVLEELKRLSLLDVNSDVRDTLAYFPHAISHFLGLDVHDVGDYSKPLMPGMVLTVEPGIYIPEEGIGVRIEDDVLITKDGCQVLGQ